MLIRSQDKTTLVTFENIVINIHNLNINNINGKEIICWSQMNPGEDEYIPLGYYSTEEKAMKVLDMIQEAYSEYQIMLNFSVSYLHEFKEKTDGFAIFQMPEDSEVEV